MDKLSRFRNCLCMLLVASLQCITIADNVTVMGRVFCVNCGAGFPSRISHPIPGTKVAVECKDHSGKKLFYNEGQTNDNGLFNILVKGEHDHELCKAYTVRDPTLCNIPSDGSHGPVSLNHNNGIDSNDRKIRPVAFISTESHPTWQAMIAEYIDCTAGSAMIINVGAKQPNGGPKLDCTAGSAMIINVGAKQPNGGPKRELRQVNNEGQELLARRRNCCHDEYCPSCKWHEAEEEPAVDADPYEAEKEPAVDADPYLIEQVYFN